MKGWNTNLLATLSLLGALLYSAAFASPISVYPLAADITANTRFQDIQILNTGNTTAYVKITPNLVQNPSSGTPTLTPYQSGDNPQTFGLMVSPLKAAIAANSERGIRIVSLNKAPAKDALYYVVVSPVKAPTTTDVSADGAKINVNVDVGVSYSVKVMVLAANPEPNVSVKVNGNNVSVTNTGNSYMSLRSGQLCDKSGKNCQSLSEANSYHVVYAGDTWNFTLPHTGVVKFNGVYAQNKSMAVQSK